jgi:hypothetical protein
VALKNDSSLLSSSAIRFRWTSAKTNKRRVFLPLTCCFLFVCTTVQLQMLAGSVPRIDESGINSRQWPVSAVPCSTHEAWSLSGSTSQAERLERRRVGQRHSVK